MAVNLPPQYHDAEARYKKAQNPEDKLAALYEMVEPRSEHAVVHGELGPDHVLVGPRLARLAQHDVCQCRRSSSASSPLSAGHTTTCATLGLISWSQPGQR